MRRIGELYTKWPFHGSRRMTAELRGAGYAVNRKRARRLMQPMGIAAIHQKPNTSRKHPSHKIYPCLSRNLGVDRPRQVWCADITADRVRGGLYIPMAKGFVYLAAVMDWFSRAVLAWRVPPAMDTEFCVEAPRDAMNRHGEPDIFNTGRGVQFTSAAFIETPPARGVAISMDGKGRFLDNIFIERLWRSLKYEEVYLKAYASVPEARTSIGAWLAFYNGERKHQSLGYRTPGEIFAAGACGYVDNASGLAQAAAQGSALPTYPQVQQQTERDSNQGRKVVASNIDLLAA